jgi:hypothetical protein
MAEFVFNLGDWPQANTSAIGLPVMSWCGSNDTDDIIVPTYKSVLSTVFGKDMENVRDVDAKCFKRVRAPPAPGFLMIGCLVMYLLLTRCALCTGGLEGKDTKAVLAREGLEPGADLLRG